MKIAISYPPIEYGKGTPLLSQNRQFQFFNSPTYIYPMVFAYAATMLSSLKHNVTWLDGIAEKKLYEQWLNELYIEHPDLVVMETKTPVVDYHWGVIKDIKRKLPGVIVCLVGDHVTWNPRETLDNSEVDYVITGGDYDFLLVDLVKSICDKKILPGGVWGRVGDARIVLNRRISKIEDSGNTPKKGVYWQSGPVELMHNLDDLPFIDRDLTKWKLYSRENGNYKFKPGTYMYSGRDCWWGRCTFCVWGNTINPRGSYRRFSPERLFSEVKYVVDKYGVREIFDDAGSFFVGLPLKRFCKILIESGYNKKVVYGCNMRFGSMDQESYDLMAKANFRLLLYGMESANQRTLDRIKKGVKVENIKKDLERVKIANSKKGKFVGLEPHITAMLGYPWETEKMALKTINLAKDLFKDGLVDSMQATIVMPYPGTPIYKECVEKKWLCVDPKDYKSFDMSVPVMKIPFSNKKLFELMTRLYLSFFTPRFIFKKLFYIRSLDDVRFFFSAAKRLLSHVLSFIIGRKGYRFKV